jgi:hypothetical protein
MDMALLFDRGRISRTDLYVKEIQAVKYRPQNVGCDADNRGRDISMRPVYLNNAPPVGCLPITKAMIRYLSNNSLEHIHSI